MVQNVLIGLSTGMDFALGIAVLQLGMDFALGIAELQLGMDFALGIAVLQLLCQDIHKICSEI